MRANDGSAWTRMRAKLHREGAIPLLREAPSWAITRTRTVASLTTHRRLRRLGYRLHGRRALADPKKVIEVDPADVTRLVPLSRFSESDPRALFDAIKCGDWDTDLPQITNQPKYIACKARVEDGLTWEETGIVDHLATRLEPDDVDAIEHGCESREDLVDLYEGQREALYKRLAHEGYQRDASPVCCRIHIGRDGELLFGEGGRHRFYLSRILGIETVPVQVLCRHCEWQDVREAVAADTPAELDPEIRTHLTHPDLSEFSLTG